MAVYATGVSRSGELEYTHDRGAAAWQLLDAAGGDGREFFQSPVERIVDDLLHSAWTRLTHRSALHDVVLQARHSATNRLDVALQLAVRVFGLQDEAPTFTKAVSPAAAARVCMRLSAALTEGVRQYAVLGGEVTTNCISILDSASETFLRHALIFDAGQGTGRPLHSVETFATSAEQVSRCIKEWIAEDPRVIHLQLSPW